MSDAPSSNPTRLRVAAGLAGAVAAVTLLFGAGPAPSVFQLAGAHEDISGNCDELEHANDPECAGTPLTVGDTTKTTVEDTTSTTVDDTTRTTVDDTTSTTAVSGTSDEVRSIDAAGAGTVIVAVEGGSLRLVAATPADGWSVEVEQPAGREVEVDFRSGTKRVQVDVEFEDGQVRERVRVRDDADDSDVRIEDAVVVRDDSRDDDDHSGPGHGVDDDSDGSDDDDHSGPGHGDDDSGHGSDDD